MKGFFAGLGKGFFVGAGIMRDVMLSNAPGVFRSDIYAVAALADATVVAVGRVLGGPTTFTAAGGAALCLGLRLAAIHRSWHLPTARWPEQIDTQSRRGALKPLGLTE